MPVTDFLIRFGVYSATRNPSLAGARRTAPRAWPSFNVDRGFSLTKVSSTAASDGLKLWMTLRDAVEKRRQPVGEIIVLRRRDDTGGHVDEPHAIAFDDAPARAPQAGVDTDDANRSSVHAYRIARTA